MRGAMFIVRDNKRDALAERVRGLPEGFVVTIAEPGRTQSQNSKLWPMLTDVSIVQPEGRVMSPDNWKTCFMSALGHEIAWAQGLLGEPLPLGFRSSRLTKRQFSDLVTFIYQWGDERGVTWSEPMPEGYGGAQ